ncbi:MAG TPA: Rid family hydrolase [Terriglobales bacterium]|nr:Rid family hydrolase [Terriglobales bacterium]
MAFANRGLSEDQQWLKGQSMRKIVSTKRAPSAIGPYSQAVRTGQFIFVSGPIPLDPTTQQIIGGDRPSAD